MLPGFDIRKDHEGRPRDETRALALIRDLTNADPVMSKLSPVLAPGTPHSEVRLAVVEIVANHDGRVIHVVEGHVLAAFSVEHPSFIEFHSARDFVRDDDGPVLQSSDELDHVRFHEEKVF